MTNHSTSTFTGVADVPIFYQRWLPEEGIRRGVVMIVHGLGEHSGRYTNLVERLLPEGYGVYALDHQGFGRSGGQRGHVERFENYAADVHRLNEIVRAEQPGHPIALFGHSMGALIALDYAQSYPGDADCWVFQAPALAAEASPALVAMLRLINLVRPAYSFTRPGSGEVSRDPAVGLAFTEDSLHVPVSTARWAVEILAAQKRVQAHISATPTPLLMLQGTADSLVIPAAVLDYFARIPAQEKTLLVYDGYYHELHNDIGKEKPLDDLIGWLNGQMGTYTQNRLKTYGL